jgi:hypothetical protein
MRWTLPKRNATRTVKKFAWLPKQIGREKIWLEYYTSNQRYEWGTWVEIGSETIDKDEENKAT